MFGGLRSQKSFLEIGLWVCMYVWLQDEYLELYISKIIKDKNTKFNTECQISVKIILLSFEENRKTGSGVGQTGNGSGSEYLINGSNDFLEIRYINTVLHVI